MTGVRVLVGTRKGAFVLTSDGARTDWTVSGPHFAGWEVYHVAGSPADPDRLWARAVRRLVRPGDPALRRRWQTWEPVGNEFSYDGRARHPPVVRRHAAAVGVRPGVAPGAVADRPGHRATRASRTPRCSARSTAAAPGTELPGLREHGSGPHWQPGRGRDVPAHDPARPARPAPDARRDLGGGRVPHRRRRRDAGGRSTAAWCPRASPTRTPRSATACTSIAMHPSRPDTLFMQKHWDVMRSDDAGEHWREISGDLPDRLRVPDRRARRTSRTPSTSCRSPATPSTIRRRASCASTAAGPAATSGSR